MSAGRRTRWGWHRLTDDWAHALVAAAGVRPGDLVLDVGAGTGALTTALVGAGARVIAVEVHPDRAGWLRERFAGAPVTVVRTDAADLRLPRRPFRVVANPPFGIATALLRRLLGRGSRLLAADLVVPRHVGRRWESDAAPGRARWAATFESRVVMRVPRGAFRPAPPHDAVVLTLRRRCADAAYGWW